MILPSLLNRTNRPDILAALLVTLLPLIYFFPAVRGEISLSPDDGVIFNVPLRATVANMIRAGYLPLWNPYIFGGMPLHGAAQAGILFPLNWFYLLSSPRIATNLMMLSTYALAALGAFLYARRSGASIMGAVATSLIWQWSGFLIAQIGHTNIVQTAALLPWLLWAVDGYGATGKRPRGLALAAIVALQAFTGHQQTLAYSLLLAAAYAIVMWRASRIARRWYLGSLLFLTAGVVLAAVQILPTYELMRNSLRARSSFDFFTSFSLPPRFLLTFLAPYVVGGGDGSLFRAPYVSEPFYGEFIGYVGLATLMLAALALLLKRDTRTKFWAAVALVALVLALGRYWPFKLYGVIYYVPILNFFRVPARHMMELNLALAVLAGRGLTAITTTQESEKTKKWALVVGPSVFLATCLAVTIGRPAGFRLGRDAPVSLMRAPELFLPVVLAAVSAWVLWMLVRRRSQRAMVFVLVVLALDLAIWGQSSGWRKSSPGRTSELWRTPETVLLLRDREQQDPRPYRILTFQQRLDPSAPPEAPVTAEEGGELIVALQPDTYMMYGVENAVGYDGFGVARYSRLAGGSTVWGDLADPERTLLGESREMDLLNVRYLIARPSANLSSPDSDFSTPAGAGFSDLNSARVDAPFTFPPATKYFGGQAFAEQDLKLPSLSAGASLSFKVPPIEADAIALLTNLSWSVDLPDGTAVARLSLHADDGRKFDFDLCVGDHTSEWAYDRPDIRRQIKNRRASVATSYPVVGARPRYQGHTYISSFKLPSQVMITGGEITVSKLSAAPELRLGVFRVSLVSGEKAFPLRAEWIVKKTAAGISQRQQRGRWQRAADLDKVSVLENTRVLPRAWLASNAQMFSDKEILEVIRSGSLPDRSLWDPLVTALVEIPVDFNRDAEQDPDSQVELTKREPNRVEARVASVAPSMLVLSESHFPGWRVYVDGSAATLLRVNYSLRGVVVPAGEHKVEFVYRPASVLIGLAISLFAFAVLLLWQARLLPEAPARRLISRLFSR